MIIKKAPRELIAKIADIVVEQGEVNYVQLLTKLRKKSGSYTEEEIYSAVIYSFVTGTVILKKWSR